MKINSGKMVMRAVQKHLSNKCSIMKKLWIEYCQNEKVVAGNVKNVPLPHGHEEKDVAEVKKSVPPHSHDETDTAEYVKNVPRVSNGLKRKRDLNDNKRRRTMAGLQSGARVRLIPHRRSTIQPRDTNCEPAKTCARTNLTDDELKLRNLYNNEYTEILNLWKQKKPYIENREKRQWFMRNRLGRFDAQRLAAPNQNERTDENRQELSGKREDAASPGEETDPIVWQMMQEFRKLSI